MACTAKTVTEEESTPLIPMDDEYYVEDEIVTGVHTASGTPWACNTETQA